MANDIIIGFDKLQRDFKQFKTVLQKDSAVVKKAARRNANILLPSVRSQIMARGGANFEHLDIIRRSIKVYTSKSKVLPGVNISLQKRVVRVGRGRTRREWWLRDYMFLVLFGSDDRVKRTKGTRWGDKTGRVEGIAASNTSPWYRTGKAMGGRALANFRNELFAELTKTMR